MELTHTYKHTKASLNFRTPFRRLFSAFIAANAPAFEAYARSGAPFGGSCRVVNPNRQQVRQEAPSAYIRKQLTELKQTVNGLNRQIETIQQLLQHTDHYRSLTGNQVPGSDDQNSNLPRVIGIARFRALKAQSAAGK